MPRRIPLRPLYSVGMTILLILLVTMPALPVLAASTSQSADASPPLDQLLSVLKDDNQRAALIRALEKAQKTPTSNSSSTSSAPSGEAADDSNDTEENTVVHGGILGALDSGLDSIQSSFSADNKVVKGWKGLLQGAQRDANTLNQKISKNPKEVSIHFLATLLVWAILVAVMILIGRIVSRQISAFSRAAQYPKITDLIHHWATFPIPSVIATLLAMYTTSMLGLHDLGRSFGLCLGFAINGGSIFASLWLSIALLANGEHRHRATTVLRKKAFFPCATIASFASLSEGILHVPMSSILGHSLSFLLSSLFSIIVSIAIVPFVLVFRRPISQLIYNRSLHFRKRRSLNVKHSLRIFSKLWPLVIVLMSIMSLYQVLHGSINENHAITQMILTMLLLMAALTALAMVRQVILPASIATQSDMLSRMRHLVHYAIVIIIGLTFCELVTRIWGGSLFNFMNSSSIGRLFGQAVFGIITVLIVTLAAWVALDALINRLLSTDKGYPSSRSVRIRTILPLLRNAAKIILCVIATITILGNIGINIAPLIAGAGVVGLAVGFGSQQLVHDVITGVFNIIENTMSIGDYIEINGVAGTVEGMSIRTVRLRDSHGALLSIPFSQVNTVKNTSRQFAYAVIDLRFTLESDITHMLELVTQAGEEVMKDPSINIFLKGPFTSWGMTSVTAEGYVVGGRFRTTTGSYSSVQYAYYTALAKLVSASDDVSFARTYTGGQDKPQLEEVPPVLPPNEGNTRQDS